MNKTRSFYNVLLEGYEAEHISPQEFSMQFNFAEAETQEQTISQINFFDSVNGIDIFYCYGSDTYYFADTDDN